MNAQQPNRFIVPSTSITEKFDEHLSLQQNKRILFSAKFGSGKSFFLSNFFNENKSYLALKLHPVDYTVSSNEDVFEVVKHDLLILIMEEFVQEIDLQKTDVDWLTAAKLWVDHKMDLFPFLPALSKVTGVGESPADAVNGLRSVFKEIGRHQKDLGTDEEELLIHYLIRERGRVGSVREIDGMTTIINELLERIRAAYLDRELVLVLDDMDRLDPEHIFRLFNVFTAHYESRTERNKFGFDKVIFVCDIENIENIFYHKYGQHVDFEGYINKFYSREIFRFDFRAHLRESLVKFFMASITGDSSVEQLDTKYYNYIFGKKKSSFARILEFVIGELIGISAIKARSFTKLSDYGVSDEILITSTGQEIRTLAYPFFTLLDILRQFFPSLNDVLHYLKILSGRFSPDYNARSNRTTHRMSNLYYELIAWCIPFILNDDDLLPRLNENGLHDFVVRNEQSQTLYGRYEVRVFDDDWLKLRKLQNDRIQVDGDLSLNCHKPNPFHFLATAIEKAAYHGLLKTSR